MAEHEYDFVLTSPTGTEEVLPPYSTTWGNDVIQDKGSKKRNWRSRKNWVSAYWTVAQKTKYALDTTWKFTRNQAWPGLKRYTPSKPQIYAFLLLMTFGVAPMFALGSVTHLDESLLKRPFYRVFDDKVLSCGDSFGTPENATVSGIEKLFVLDNTFGRFSFSQAKTLDVAWDILVGRGVQLMAWWVGYVVFSDALLRAIERHPASFQIFQRIALEGPSVMALWTLIRELWCAKSKRTKALFFYIWMSTLFITCIPMFLSAMTGYDSTSIAWVSLDDSNNIVPASVMEYSGVVSGTWNSTFEDAACVNYTTYNRAYSEYQAIRQSPACHCQLRNGTVISSNAWRLMTYYEYPYDQSDCIFNYPGNNQTFTDDRYYYGNYETVRADNTYPCGSTFNITLNGKTYDSLDLNITYGYCHNKKAYNRSYLENTSRCLPDTANPSYQWGFSTMMSGVFIFFHFGWCVTMWVVWQDAQFCSTLVKGGYQMTPLRAAFAMAKAAKRKTGMGEKALVRANTKEIEQEMYGNRRREGTKLDYGIFADVDEEHGDVEEVLRRRPLRPKIDPGSSETTLS